MTVFLKSAVFIENCLMFRFDGVYDMLTQNFVDVNYYLLSQVSQTGASALNIATQEVRP